MKFHIVFQNLTTGINLIFHLGSLLNLFQFVWSENFQKPRPNTWPSQSLSHLPDDVLSPYVLNNHGSRLNHRDIRECAIFESGSRPHEILSSSNVSFEEDLLETRTFRHTLKSYTINGHYSLISDPLKHISVLEPRKINGCATKTRETVLETSKQKECVIAINAGYFNMKTGACLGDIVVDGQLVQSSGGIQNVHFGIKKDGSLLIGYVSEEEVVNGNFMQLVGGVVWIVRNGSNFVNSSMQLECSDTEDTGSMETFVNVRSGRSAVGYDYYGNVILAQVDGKTNQAGATLWDMAELMIKLGAINAINLDGGGSATFVVNGTIVNYPSDECPDKDFSCAREVSTILCAHYSECDPPDCNGHGVCHKGVCECNPQTHWTGPKCNILDCKNETYCHPGRGICGSNGCNCNPGWTGKHCNQSCSSSKFGKNCKQNCFCLNGASCDSANGHCHCAQGYYGHHCEKECPIGYYGFNCEEKCFCDQSCFCNHVTGACTKPDNSSKSVFHCLMRNSSEFFRNEIGETNSYVWKYATLVLAASTALSLAANMILLCCSCSCSCKHRQPPGLGLTTGSSLTSALQANPWGLKASGLAVLKTKKPYRPVRLADVLATSSSSSSEEEEDHHDWGRINTERLTKTRAS